MARFKGSNARSAPFFLCVRWYGTCKQQIREVGGPAQHLVLSTCERESGSESGWVNGGMISDSRSLLSAGECLVE
jgi:hypothetical protein